MQGAPAIDELGPAGLAQQLIQPDRIGLAGDGQGLFGLTPTALDTTLTGTAASDAGA